MDGGPPRFSRRQVTKRKFYIPVLEISNLQTEFNSPKKKPIHDPVEDIPLPGDVSTSFLASTPKPGRPQLSRRRPISPVRENTVSTPTIRSHASSSQNSLLNTRSRSSNARNKSGVQSHLVSIENTSQPAAISKSGSKNLEASHQNVTINLSGRKTNSLGKSIDDKMVSLNKARLEQKRRRKEAIVRSKQSHNVNGFEATSLEVSENVSAVGHSEQFPAKKRQKTSVPVNDVLVTNRSTSGSEMIEQPSSSRLQHGVKSDRRTLSKSVETDASDGGLHAVTKNTSRKQKSPVNKQASKLENKNMQTKKRASLQNKPNMKSVKSTRGARSSSYTDSGSSDDNLAQPPAVGTKQAAHTEKNMSVSAADRRLAVNKRLQALNKSKDNTSVSATRVMIWEDDKKRTMKDVTDLDVVLTAVTDILESHCDAYVTDEEEAAVKMLQKYLTQDITHLISGAQTVRTLQADIKKREQSVKQKQKALMSLQKERILLEEECEPLKLRQVRNENMAVINTFLNDLSNLINKC